MSTPARRERESMRQQVLAWLEELDDRQFVELFQELAARRGGGGLEEWQVHLVLAEAERGRDGWRLELLSPATEGGEGAQVLAQSGRCRPCDQAVRSWGRVSSCPICGRVVYCS